MLSECRERLRLAQLVAQKITDVAALKELKDSGKELGMDDLLSRARTEQRISEQALSDHLRKHGCIR